MKKIIFILIVFNCFIVNGQNRPAVFHVKLPSDPVSYIGTHCGTSVISKRELLSINEITIKCIKNGVTLPVSFKVVSFQFETTVNGNPVMYLCTGEKISQEIKDWIKRGVIGAKIYFENVKAKGLDDIVRNVPGLTLVIK